MIERIIDLLESKVATAIGGIFLIASLALSYFEIFLPLDPAFITIFISGLPILYSAIRKLIYNKGISKISSAMLISIAMIAAAIIGDVFAAGEVAFIMAIGEILEDLTTSRAKKGLKKLIALAPRMGRRISDEGEKLIPSEEIRKGDILRILPGETIPVDGIIIKGETTADQAILTGESMPIEKLIGDELFCGTTNLLGAVEIRATKVGEDSSLGRLIRMVKEAGERKAPIARIADKSASLLVPAALLIAIITGILTENITRAVTVLVVFCPCALVLATPTAIMAAIGQATKRGIIIKSGEALEKMGKVDAFAFDKTGTLTEGRLKVSDILPTENSSEDELLRLAASAEAFSEHPLAKAISEEAGKRGLKLSENNNFKMELSRGVSADIEGKRVVCGNDAFLNEQGISFEKQHVDAFKAQGKAPVIVAVDGEAVGVIALSDTLREDSKAAIEKLKLLGVEAHLLTGDSAPSARYFAEKLGLESFKAELLPEDKVDNIISLQSDGKTVAMIGDGVNDAPALKTADVGIAMSTIGSDIATETADIALMSDDICKLPYLKRLGKATVNTIKLSISLSMIINILAVLLSVLGLLTPTTGALVHNAGSCFVVLIAALLYDRKFKNV